MRLTIAREKVLICSPTTESVMTLTGKLTFVLFLCLAATGVLDANVPPGLLQKRNDWYAGDEAKRIAANILSFQSEGGAWPKNTDTTKAPFAGKPAELTPSFDNSATTDELRFLARVHQATKDDNYRKAFVKGMDFVLKAQYPTGGWPQTYPPPASYHRHITFNDNSMVRLMEFLRETRQLEGYSFLDEGRRKAARQAFDQAVNCILKCQIKVEGKRTAWCAQHDEKDYSPRPGRTYELVSLSGSESVAIVRLLMSLDDPRPDVVEAIEGAVTWFDAVKITGIRVETRKDPKAPKGTDRVVVKDAAALPLWARFYEIGTNRPIYADRDGVAKRELAEIGYERRNGYAWLGAWPQRLLESEYPAWKRKRESKTKG
jgi:PelA/Pel-15E family pectate lyase